MEKIKQKKEKGRDAQQLDVAMMGGGEKREREKKEVGMDRR